MPDGVDFPGRARVPSRLHSSFQSCSSSFAQVVAIPAEEDKVLLAWETLQRYFRSWMNYSNDWSMRPPLIWGAAEESKPRM